MIKNLIIFCALFVGVYSAACNLKAEEQKYAKFYKKYYLSSLTLPQATQLVKKMEAFLADPSTGDMGAFYDFVVPTGVSLLPAAKQQAYQTALNKAGASIGSGAKLTTLFGQLKAAVVKVANPLFLASRKAAAAKSSTCLIIKAMGPYFNNVNTKAVIKELKKTANAADLKKLKAAAKGVLPLLALA